MGKYGNRKTQTIDGMVFDSRKEASRWGELKLMERAGLIKDIQTQVKFELIPKQDGEKACYYIADFVYTDCETGNKVVEDTKGYKTEVYRIKRKLMLKVHNIKIKET
jgi:hypothetical protein